VRATKMGMQHSVQQIRESSGCGCGEPGLRRTRRIGGDGMSVREDGCVWARGFCALAIVGGGNSRDEL
jgi:hypothetical protein